MPSKKGEPFRWDPLVRLTHWGLAAVCIGNLWVNEAGRSGTSGWVTAPLGWSPCVCSGGSPSPVATPALAPSSPAVRIFASRRARCVSGSLRHRVIMAAASWPCGHSGWSCWPPLAAAGFKIPRWVLNWAPTSGMSGAWWRCRGWLVCICWPLSSPPGVSAVIWFPGCCLPSGVAHPSRAAATSRPEAQH